MRDAVVRVTFKVFYQLLSHREMWDSNVLLERKQTLGGLVSGVLRELNVMFYLFQKVLATWYSTYDQRHTPGLPQSWCRACDRDCKAACVLGEMTDTGRRSWEHQNCSQWCREEWGQLPGRDACWLEEGGDWQSWQEEGRLCELTNRRGSKQSGGTSDPKARRERGFISPHQGAGWEAQRDLSQELWKGLLRPRGMSCELDADCFQRLRSQRQFASIS